MRWNAGLCHGGALRRKDPAATANVLHSTSQCLLAAAHCPLPLRRVAEWRVPRRLHGTREQESR